MVRARFFLPAAALVATTLKGQEPRTVAVAEPALSGVVRDVGGQPLPNVEVGIVKGERLQQFVLFAFVVLVTECSSSTSTPAFPLPEHST